MKFVHIKFLPHAHSYSATVKTLFSTVCVCVCVLSGCTVQWVKEKITLLKSFSCNKTVF